MGATVETHECRILEEFHLQDGGGGVNGQTSENDLAAKDKDKDKDGGGGKKGRRGQNKNRPLPMKFLPEIRLCPVLIDVVSAENDDEQQRSTAGGSGDDVTSVSAGEETAIKPGGGLDGSSACRYGDRCHFMHDVPSYLRSKPQDIAAECHVFKTRGRCRWGLACRFGDSHIDRETGRNLVAPICDDKASKESNHLSKQLLWDLRKNSYDFKDSNRIVEGAFQTYDDLTKSAAAGETPAAGHADFAASCKRLKVEECGPVSADDPGNPENGRQPPPTAIDWKDKLYLAPLTTVGNLPFRRICKRFGADITCGEMAMSQPLLTGHQPEWALLHRHESEDIFGIQICGSSPHQMARVAQLVADGHIECSFVDVNLGCPIDLVYRKGMGSGMMNRKKPLEVMVRSMSAILSRANVPLTLKMRTGVYSDKSIAHTLVGPALGQWGASMVTVHGRSREQRYTKLADWDYINKCAAAVPPGDGFVFGNGDIINFEDYNRLREAAPKVSGVMIARGALIKPWVFREIKEQKHIDVSAEERLDMVRDYVNYGLEHWGSDDKGVETTRRFLLEWLSFLHRYVPLGLLAHPPQRMNERVPRFRGRSDLETLLCSPSCADWIKISEMFLGRVPDSFAFEPKHRANGYK